jgi:glycine cleavage system H protein
MGEEDYSIPVDLLYDRNHMWCREENDLRVIGWTDYAQFSAGDVRYISLQAKKGDVIETGNEFGTIETGKWVGKLYSPVPGEIIEVNAKIVKEPELINGSPYTEGWLVKIKPVEEEKTGLLTPDEYQEIIKTEGGF